MLDRREGRRPSAGVQRQLNGDGGFYFCAWVLFVIPGSAFVVNSLKKGNKVGNSLRDGIEKAKVVAIFIVSSLPPEWLDVITSERHCNESDEAE